MGISNRFYSKVSPYNVRRSRIDKVTRPKHYSRWEYDYLVGIAPVENVAVSQSGSDAVITWTPRSADFTNYMVYASDDNGANYSVIGTVTDETVGTFTYSDPGEGQYSFYVVGDNAAGAISPRSNIDSLYLNLAPTDPSNLAVVAENEAATLTWDPSVDQNLLEYILYLDATEVDRVPAGTETFEFTGLTNDNTYTFGVRAKDAKGLLSSTTTIVDTVVDTIAPSAPTGVSATGGDGSADVSWNANAEPDVDGYNVYVDGTKVNGALIAGTSYTANGLSVGTVTIRVSAVDESGNESALSDATTAVVIDLAPSPPTGLSVGSKNEGLSASWDANSEGDIDGYNVYVDGTKDNTGLIASTTYDIASLTNNTEYDVQVSAVDNAGQESSLSSIVSGTPIGEVNAGALSFDGSTSYIDTGVNNMFGSDKVSIGFYVRLDDIPSSFTMPFGGSRYDLSEAKRFYIGFGYRTWNDKVELEWGVGLGKDVYTTNEDYLAKEFIKPDFYFCVLTIDKIAKTFALYANGEKVLSDSFVINLTDPLNEDKTFHLGAGKRYDTVAMNNHCPATLDTVFVLDRIVADVDEVNSLYNTVASLETDPDLLHLWKLDSSTVKDSVTGTVATTTNNVTEEPALFDPSKDPLFLYETKWSFNSYTVASGDTCNTWGLVEVALTGDLTVNGTINGDGGGYKGGRENFGSGDGPGGGPGQDNDGGPGGSYGGQGGTAPDAYTQGTTYGAAEGDGIKMGSGGATGDDTRNTSATNQGFGGNGGGAVKFLCDGDFKGSGTITMNGDDGEDTDDVRAGGGGSGGGIFVLANNITFDGTLRADGGDGGENLTDPGNDSGGGGGGGRIKMAYKTSDDQAYTTSVAGGDAPSSGIASDDGADGTARSYLKNWLYSESFETSFGDWVNVGAYNWLRISGGTPSSNTGPSSASLGSYYIYFEATGSNPGNTATIQYTFASATKGNITFDYHQDGIEQGTLYLEAYDGSSWTELWSSTGDKGDQWRQEDINYPAGTTKLRFRNVGAGAYRGDVALYNIKIFED